MPGMSSGVPKSPAIGSDGTVYVGSMANRLYAFNSNGAVRWSYSTGAQPSGQSIGPDGTVYVGFDDNRLYAFKSNGARSWSYMMGKHAYSSPAIGSDGTVYVGSYDNRLYAFHFSGGFRWTYRTGGTVESSPAIGSDGTVYVGSLDNRFYAVNSAGMLRWSYSTGPISSASSPAIGSDGTIYFGTGDNRLWSVGVPTTPTPTPVPPAQVDVSGSTVSPGDTLSAVFRTNQPISQPFTAYAVVIFPDGATMVNVLDFSTALKPVASDVQGLPAGFEYTLINNLVIPGTIPPGRYEIVAAFFTPGRPITSRDDAFYQASVFVTVQR